MTRAALLLVLLSLVPAASFAEEDEGSTDCGLFAVMPRASKGEWNVYDGIRMGLELACLPRICLEEVDPWPGGLGKLVDRLEKSGDPGPLFAVGDLACEALVTVETTYPRVFAVRRYSVGGKPLRPLPEALGSAVVYADVRAEQLGEVLLGLFGRKDVRADFAWGPIDAPDRGEDLARLRKAAGIADPHEEREKPLEALLHLQLGIDYGLSPYASAVALAKRHGVPLISDDLGRFGQGAVITIVPSHKLVGRAAADAGRRLRADPATKLKERAITAVEVWIDLHAADQQGLQLPLPFVAKADKLKPSRVPR